MAMDDGHTFVLLEFLIVGLVFSYHVRQRRVQVTELHLTVDVFVVVLPSPVFKENRVQRTIRPVCFLKHSEKTIEVDLLNQNLFALFWVLDLLAHSFVVHRPIKSTVLGIVSIFVEVNDIKLVLDPFDGHRFGRVGSVVAPLINRVVKLLGVLGVVLHGGLVVVRGWSSLLQLLLLQLVLFFVKPFKFRAHGRHVSF
jgi:hypothetical protein